MVTKEDIVDAMLAIAPEHLLNSGYIADDIADAVASYRAALDAIVSDRNTVEATLPSGAGIKAYARLVLYKARQPEEQAE